MAPGSAERQMYHSFWNKFSDRADNTSMLLNANADELEELDRAEILSMLPDVTGKSVVDIGAGIGRFTTEFAKRARRVVSADFMESFIEKNRQLNAHFDNIDWRVGDALGLDIEAGSVDLVFTNWLLMYLADEEAVRFLHSVLRWLRPGGHLHLRESCSEPSTPRSGGTSLHNQSETNPTRYRFSSAYIQLLRQIRFKESSGQIWRFNVHWACSVEVYIEKNTNWRQIHWLVSKVPAETELGIGIDELKLSGALGTGWPKEQAEWDRQLDAKAAGNRQLTEKLAASLTDRFGPEFVVFTFNACKDDASSFVFDSQTLANHLNCRVWSVDTNPFCYRHSLTLANGAKDRRIRLGWHADLQSALTFWTHQRPGEEERPRFDAFLAVGLLEHVQGPSDVARIGELLPAGAQLATLETSSAGLEEKKMKLFADYFTIEKCEEVKVMGPGEVKALLLTARRKGGKSSTTTSELTTTEAEWKQLINQGF